MKKTIMITLALIIILIIVSCKQIPTINEEEEEEEEDDALKTDSLLLARYTLAGKWYIHDYSVCEKFTHQKLKDNCLSANLTPQIKHREDFLDQPKQVACAKKQTRSPYGQCIYQAAYDDLDSGICNFARQPTPIANCVSNVAIHSNDLRLCKSISCNTMNWLNVDCSEFSLSYPKNKCLLELGKKQGCDKISEYDFMFDKCMYQTMDKTLESCKKLRNHNEEQIKDYCITDAAMISQQYDFCDEIEDSSKKERCIAYVAINLTDVTGCKGLNEWWKPQCITAIAAKKRDTSICNNLDSIQKDKCIKQVATAIEKLGP